MALPNHGPRPGQKDDISLVKYKSVIKLFVAATAGCQGAKNRVFASFCSGIHRKHPTHALQHTAGTTPPSGTPCEFTGRVWEVACCSGKPKWAQDTAKTEVSSRNGTWTQLGALPWGGGHLADWCWCVGVGGGLASQWGVTGVVGATSGEFLRLGSRSRNGTWTQLGCIFLPNLGPAV